MSARSPDSRQYSLFSLNLGPPNQLTEFHAQGRSTGGTRGPRATERMQGRAEKPPIMRDRRIRLHVLWLGTRRTLQTNVLPMK